MLEAVTTISSTLHCDFDNGRSLGVLWGVDNFTVIGQEEAPAEDKGMDMM